jgi:DNA-binding transcriptional ArsR family regulator
MSVQLNAHFETMSLLCLCPWGEKGKNELRTEINKLGIDGQEFYNRNYRLVEQYYHAFEKHRITSTGATLMHEMEDVLFVVCTNVFGQNPDWFSDIDKISDDAAQSAVHDTLMSEYGDNGGDLITTLDAMALTDRAKWQLIVFHQRAGQQLRLIASAVAENLPAYKKACVKIESELSTLLQHFKQCLAQPQKTGFLRLPEQISPDIAIIPTMALPVSIILIKDVCFYGLLSYKLFAGGAALTKDELLMGAKALSEKSKVEILLCLKESSRYNLEIADLVGLTPATISHHMNTLLVSGFVELEKKDGKVYYRLARDGLKRYLASVKHLLLS